MISDEPDEDADILDDEKLMEAYLGAESKDRSVRSDAVRALPDWPPAATADAILTVDGATAAWFKANHADWQRQVRLVLRAWTVAHTETTERPAIP